MTFANADVLQFYREMPFNYWQSSDAQSDEIARTDLATTYPTLTAVVGPGLRVLEVGCGVGWLSSHLAQKYGCEVTAIDFNPVAIERAIAIAERLHVSTRFEVADLFTYTPSAPYPLVVSIGVLHHTNDCAAGLRRCFDVFAAPQADVFIGLYHAFGRKPFLDHFRQLRATGADESELFIEYCRLHHWAADSTSVYSWFRDQVLHPHETQHTLREVAAIAAGFGFHLVATSLNGFRSCADVERLLRQERDQEQVARHRLAQGQYFPGFFLAHFRRAGRDIDQPTVTVERVREARS